MNRVFSFYIRDIFSKMFLILSLLFFLLFNSVFTISEVLAYYYEIKVLASVNDTIITNIDLENTWEVIKRTSIVDGVDHEIQEIKNQLLNDKIDEILVFEMSNKLGLEISYEEEEFIKSQIDSMYNLDSDIIKVYYNRIKSNILLSKLVNMEYVVPVYVSDKDIAKYKKELKNGEQKILDSVKIISYTFPQGYDFEKVEYIFDNIHNEYETYDEVNIADPIWVKIDLLPTIIQEAIHNLNITQYTKPLKIGGSYKVFEIQDKENSIILDTVVTGVEFGGKYYRDVCSSGKKIQIDLCDVNTESRDLLFNSESGKIIKRNKINYKENYKENFIVCSNNSDEKIENVLIMKKNAERYDSVIQRLRNKAVINVRGNI